MGESDPGVLLRPGPALDPAAALEWAMLDARARVRRECCDILLCGYMRSEILYKEAEPICAPGSRPLTARL